MESIKNKIKKLLDTKGRTEAEAMCAIKKAQELLAKHHLTLKDLDNFEKSSVVEKRIDKKTYKISKRLEIITCAISSHFRCKVIGSEYNLFLVGHEEDVNTAEYVIHFIEKEYQKSFNELELLGKTKADKIKLKNSYLVGFLKGCLDMLKANEEQYALVLTVPQEVEKYIEDNTIGSIAPSDLPTDTDILSSLLYEVGISDGTNTFSNKNRISTTTLPG